MLLISVRQIPVRSWLLVCLYALISIGLGSAIVYLTTIPDEPGSTLSHAPHYSNFWSTVIGKTGHLGMFTFFSLSLSIMWKELKRPLLLALAFGGTSAFILGILTEWLQRSVPGRDSQGIDVIIDIAGPVAIFVTAFLSSRTKKVLRILWSKEVFSTKIRQSRDDWLSGYQTVMGIAAVVILFAIFVATAFNEIS